MTTLSDEGIIEYRNLNRIVIEPFRLADVNTASYDVRLGPWYYREQLPGEFDSLDPFETINPYSPAAATRVWGEKQYAELAADWMKARPYYDWRGISPRDRIILIRPQENLLCHTQEFIGGRSNVTTAMKARSTIGRMTLNVCQCAGQGDIGYFNRWTMEVYSRSPHSAFFLVVGRRVAQIVFDVTTATDRSYGTEGNYQQGDDVQELIRNWRPEMMLPQMHTDRDIPEDAIR